MRCQTGDGAFRRPFFCCPMTGWFMGVLSSATGGRPGSHYVAGEILMRSFSYVATIVLLFSSSVRAGEEPLPTYYRVNVADSGFDDQRDDPVFSLMQIDEKDKTLLFGDYGIGSVECAAGFLCVDAMPLVFAVPKSCGEGAKWHYRDRTYRVVGTADRSNESNGATKHIVEGPDKNGRIESISLYSTSKGLEGFSTVDPSGKNRELVHYQLVSNRGAMPGGCVKPDSKK